MVKKAANNQNIFKNTNVFLKKMVSGESGLKLYQFQEPLLHSVLFTV